MYVLIFKYFLFFHIYDTRKTIKKKMKIYFATSEFRLLALRVQRWCTTVFSLTFSVLLYLEINASNPKLCQFCRLFFKYCWIRNSILKILCQISVAVSHDGGGFVFKQLWRMESSFLYLQTYPPRLLGLCTIGMIGSSLGLLLDCLALYSSRLMALGPADIATDGISAFTSGLVSFPKLVLLNKIGMHPVVFLLDWCSLIMDSTQLYLLTGVPLKLPDSNSRADIVHVWQDRHVITRNVYCLV